MLKKLTVSVLAVAFAFMAYAPAANAQFTTAQLEAAGFTADEIALLQAFLGGSTGSTGSSNACPVDPTTVATGLSVGTSSPDARNVQVLMNFFASELGLNTRVAASGAGSAGMETNYYGGLTAQAVTNFQEAYRAEVLTPNGLAMGTGYYGPATSAQVEAVCNSLGMDDDTDTPVDNGGDDDDDMDDDNDLRGGESSLEDFDLSPEEDVEEGEMALVATAEFDVEDGDARLARLDLTFEAGATNEEDEPWDTFETLTVMLDGDEIAEVDVDDEDDWLEDDEPYEFRVRLDEVVREGDNVELEIYLTAQSSVDGADANAADWTIYIQDEGLRARDGEGVDVYTGDDNDQVTFEVEEEGSDDEFDVKSSSNDPDAATIKVEDDRDSDDYAIFVFELETEESDIEVDTLPVVVRTTDARVSSIVDDLMLEVDGDEYDDFSYLPIDNDGLDNDGDGTIDNEDVDTAGDYEDAETANTDFVGFQRVAEFDLDNDLVIDGDETVDVTLVATFNAADGANYNPGATIQALVMSDPAAQDTDSTNTDEFDDQLDITGEGADDIVADGAADSDVHTLLVEGIAVERTDSSAVRITNDGAADDQADFMLEFDVMAFEEDAFISENVSVSFNYSIIDANDGTVVYDSDDTATTGEGQAVASISSDAELESGYYEVSEGDTETFTLDVTYDPYSTDATDGDATAAGAGSYRLRLDSIEFRDTAASPNQTFNAVPASEYRTGNVNITS